MSLGYNGGLGGGGETGPLLGQALAPPLPLLLQPGGQQLLVLGGVGLGLGDPLLLVGDPRALPLQRQGRHQPLDLGGLAALLACQPTKLVRFTAQAGHRSSQIIGPDRGPLNSTRRSVDD